MTTREVIHGIKKHIQQPPSSCPISLHSPLKMTFLRSYAPLKYVFFFFPSSSVKPCCHDISIITGSCLQLAVQMCKGWEMIWDICFFVFCRPNSHPRSHIQRAQGQFSPTGPLPPSPPAHPISGKSSSAALCYERRVCRYRRAGLQGLTLQQEADLQPRTGTIYQHSAACHQSGQTELPWAKIDSPKKKKSVQN